MATRAHTVPRFYLSGFTTPSSAPKHEPFVWIGSIATGAIERRAPKNVSPISGYYDGPGGFDDGTTTIEAHLSKIESEAAFAIRRFESGADASPSNAIWRFLAWQAARTPGWAAKEQEWMNDASIWEAEIAEPPPPGINAIRERYRSLQVMNPTTGESRQVDSAAELENLQRAGWRWVMSREDRLESLHLQAWFFQERHFPRLKWSRLTSPPGEHYVTSDRAVTWLVDGYVDTPPAALRHSAAQVVAPLTQKIALFGRHHASKLHVRPREINRFVACTASQWVAGPTEEVVSQALADRRAAELEAQ